MSTLGSRLKEARENKRLTQMEVANKLGISNGTLSGYERNYRDTDTDILSKLAELYDVTPNWLLRGGNELLSQYLKLQENRNSAPDFFTSKDKRDLKKFLEEEKEVMFNGVPLSKEDKEKVSRVMEAMFMDAKKQNKHKKKNEPGE